MNLDLGLFFGGAFLALYLFAFNRPKQRIWLILIGSLLFYSMLEYWFIPILLGSALVDFFLARTIADIDDAASNAIARRRALLMLSIALNLGLLFIFKIRGSSPPVGLSFYIFQSMGYVIDVYRGEIEARRRPLEFVSGVCFFPHLLAGPILRSTDLLPQFENLPRTLSASRAHEAMLLITVGLLKKGIADLLARNADAFFESGSAGGFFQSWLGVLSFAGQIYGDFSGYSDLAVGFALLLGIRLPRNFNAPYVATSPADYWNRWHISLSSWFRDYLFTPLSMWMLRKNRGTPSIAVLISMILIGLWHGFRYTFLFFGLYHGVLIVLTHALSRHFVSLRSPRGFQRAFQIALTFYLMTLGHVLFRSGSLEQARAVLGSLHAGSWADLHACALPLAGVGCALLCLHFINHWLEADSVTMRSPGLGWAASGLLAAVGVALVGSLQPFIYFQF